MAQTARVVASFGRRFLVQQSDGGILPAVTRGKKTGVACGDGVTVQASGDGLTIEEVLPRRNQLHRADAWREKIIAANVDQVLLVLAAEPGPGIEFLQRALVAAEAAGIPVILLLNKTDLAGSAALRERWLTPLAAVGYPLLELQASRDASVLCPLLRHRTSLLVGQSGMGKSTIVNALVPGANSETNEISRALDSGRHTTTHARMHFLADGGALIDCPGLETFGIQHLDPEDIAHAFPEFRPHLGRCRFNDCRHLAEPGCAVLAAHGAGRIMDWRLATYHRLLAEPRPPDWNRPAHLQRG